MIKSLSPIMRQAIRDCRALWFAAEIWLSCLNKSVDSLSDFQENRAQSHIDVSSVEGSARLAIIPNDVVIEQPDHDTDLDMYDNTDPDWSFVGKFVWQGFPLDTGRQLNAVTVRVDATGAGGAADLQGLIVSNLQHSSGSDGSFGSTYTVHHNFNITIADGYVGDVRTAFANPPLLPAGSYWLMIVNKITNGRQVMLRYKNADAYSGGDLAYADAYFTPTSGPHFDTAHVFLPNADLCFKLEFSAYATRGSFTTKVIDLGSVPTVRGEYQLSSSVPTGCGLRLDLYGTNNEDLSAPIVYEDIQDGAEIEPRRFWWWDVLETSNASRDATPEVDRLEVLFATRRRFFRQYNRALRHVSADVLDMEPLLAPGEYKASEIKILERVSSIGEFTVNLRSARPEPLQELISDNALKNYRVRLYLGADVNGLTRSDLFEYFGGLVKAPKVKPQFDAGNYEVSLTVTNPMMELKRKIPSPKASGLIELGDIAINRDGVHVCDSMHEDIRGEANVPARFVDLQSFRDGKDRVGGGDLAASAFIIRCSNAPGLPDTRKQSPEELRKYLEAQCVIADGYIIMDERSRISLLLHDPDAEPEETWADLALVRQGLNAVPIYGMASIDLMYEEWLYNAVICGCDWNGTSGKWETFAKKYAYTNGDSINEYAMGEAEHISIMEKNMIEASKYLGPESGYGGETLAWYIAQKLGKRFAYPPAVIKGCVVPTSQLERGTGAVVRIISNEFVAKGQRGILPAETRKFMLLGPKYNQAKNRMVTDLVQLK